MRTSSCSLHMLCAAIPTWSRCTAAGPSPGRMWSWSSWTAGDFAISCTQHGRLTWSERWMSATPSPARLPPPRTPASSTATSSRRTFCSDPTATSSWATSTSPASSATAVARYRAVLSFDYAAPEVWDGRSSAHRTCTRWLRSLRVPGRPAAVQRRVRRGIPCPPRAASRPGCPPAGRAGGPARADRPTTRQGSGQRPADARIVLQRLEAIGKELPAVDGARRCDAAGVHRAVGRRIAASDHAMGVARSEQVDRSGSNDRAVLW